MFFIFDANAGPAFTWSQVVSNDSLSVRAIVEGDEQCPVAVVDGKRIPMNLRAAPESDDNTKFPERVCEVVVSRLTKKIVVDGSLVPVLPQKIKKIAVVGDTGCRVSSLEQQDCKFSKEWPLKKILTNVSRHKPDLVIHVGDYLYREKKCRDDKKCGKVYGDHWYTWKADWLWPSKSLSTKAPFLFARGNHESCKRSYKGWFRYLDSGVGLQQNESCNDFVDTWAFETDELQFYIFDSSSGSDLEASSEQINGLKEKFLPVITNKAQKNVWFVTHRPVWAYAKRMKLINYGNLPQQQTFGSVFPKNVSHILSGHAHVAQILSMENVPNQIIIGNGGTSLDVQDDADVKNDIKIGDFKASSVKSMLGFGFAVIDMENDKVIFYSQDNEEVYSYSFLKT